ncbi:putative GntR family transcriptional regulator [Streptomyces sp. Tu6071]|nr:putative GntR family transcriptional regulator [Streptomyces sp. Tu6071]
MEWWRELATAGQFAGDLPTLLDRCLVGRAGLVELVMDLVGKRFELGVGEMCEFAGSPVGLAFDLLALEVLDDLGAVVLAGCRGGADEDTAPLDGVDQPLALEEAKGVLRGGVGDGEPLLQLTRGGQLGAAPSSSHP